MQVFKKGENTIVRRQAPGFILPTNVQLQIRQPDVSKGKAKLRLLCND